MKDKYYMGIDPGSDGAIAVINQDKHIVELWTFPKNGKEFDLQSCCMFLEYISKFDIHAVLEDVHAIQGKAGGTSNFNFGRAKMIWEMGLIAYKIPHTLVQPKEWQKHAWQGVTKTMKSTSRTKKDGTAVKKVDTKTTSLTAVQRLYPFAELRDPNRKTERTNKPHEGIIDGLLMADYCRAKFY